MNSAFLPLCKKINNESLQMKLSDVKPTLLPEEANEEIANSIKDAFPFMAARFGRTELITLLNYEHYKNLRWHGKLVKRVTAGYFPFGMTYFKNILKYSGFFPVNEQSIRLFSDEMNKAMEEVDLLGSWIDGEAYYSSNLKYAKPCRLNALEPYRFDRPWSSYLESKRVLVVHPFSETIKKQYERKRKEIFKNQMILPKFDIRCVKAVQTLMGEKAKFNSWFDALDYMTEKSLENDFDVAIVGCGAYGFPLSARLKRYGKRVVHLGGALQVLFGIKGKRFDANPDINKMYNSSWVRPSSDERIKKMKKVEDSCYW